MLRDALLRDDLLKGLRRGAVEVAGRLFRGHPLLASHLMEFASGVHQALARLSQRRSDSCQGRDLVAAQGISGLLQSLRYLDEGSSFWRLGLFPFRSWQHGPDLL